MNAPLDGLIANSTSPIQPQINTGLDLLIAGHQIYDGPMIDIYGETDTGYGYEAQDICLTGTTVSLYGLVSERLVDGKYQSNELLQSLSVICDDILPSAKQMREAARMEALIDRAEERKELQA